MILNKQVGVFLNLVHCQFKQYLKKVFHKHGFDMTPEQFLVMDTLWDEGVLSQQQIADIILKDKNSVTKLIDALEKKNLVVRRMDDTDRRLNKIHLTEYSISIKDKITQIALDSTDRIIKDIPKEDLKNFVKVLNSMSRNMTAFNGSEESV
jgi:DNA-binding MarR family transcriptional regulator